MDEYKISLGVELETSDIISQINTAEKKLDPIKIKVDAETKELTNTIKDALKSLSSGTKNTLTLDTTKLEGSIADIRDAVVDLKKIFGSLDDSANLKPLLYSVNQIATALGKVENESDSLLKSLSALSNKDFSVNFGIDMGKKNNNMIAYGRAARKQIIPELEAQIKELESLLGGQQATMSKLASKGNKIGFDVFTDFGDFNSDSAIKKMEAMEKYINSLKKLAALDNVKLDGFNEVHKNATELINDITGVEDAVDKAGDIPDKIKKFFGGSLDVEGLAGQLQPIITDLSEIKTAIQGLSSNNSIDSLTQSFNRLSETLEKLTTNLTLAKNTLDTGFSDTTPVNNAVKAAQKTGQKIGETIKQSINIDDVIDKEVSKLMNEYAITGSKAFDEIRQSLVNFKNGSGDINKVTSAISNNMKVVNEAKNDYKDLADYIRMFNASGAKVHIPDSIKQEYGDDYKSMRSQLGKGFTSGQGMDFETFIEETNEILGQTIDLSHGAEAAFGDLVRKINSTKGGKFLTGDDLFRNGILDMGDVVANVSTSLEQIENAEEEIARASTAYTNIVAQNEERKQQAYRETSGVIENLKTTLETMRVDRSSIDAIIKDVEELGFTATDTSVKMKNGNFDITVNGVDSIGKAITEIRHLDSATGEISLVDRKISQSLTETDKFVKQQKQAVSNLTNQINQLNRAASDQNASRPIKDTSHLDALKSKYNEIISAIQRMESASSDTFVDEQNNVKALISDFKSLVSEYKNAENVSSKMKGTDFASGLDIAKNDLEKFKAQAKDFPQIAQTIENLDKAIEGVGDASSLNKFNDQLRVARSELAKIKSEITANNRSEKVGINVSGLQSKIADLQRISPEINKFEAEIDGAKVSIRSLLNDLGKINTQGDFSVVNSRFKAFADAAKSAGIAITEVVSKVKSVGDIKLDIELGTYDNQMSQMYEKFDRLSDATKELCNNVQITENAYRELINTAKPINGVIDDDKLAQSQKEYANALEKTNNLLKIQTREEKARIAAQKLAQDKDSLKLDTLNWLNENSRAANKYGDELKRLISLLDKVDDTVAFKNIARDIKNVQKTAQVMGKTGMTVFDKLKTKAKEYMTYLSAAELFMYAEQALRSMFEQVKLIDSAMTELKKVTDETNASYEKFLTNAASKAKEIGTTIDGLVSSTADFARLGYGFEDAQGLAEVANIYAVVGDEIDSVETATQSLISTLTAFKDEAGNLSNSDFALSIVDKMNEVSNNFAISSGGIGDALQRSASSMMAANNSLDETIALITAANTVVQDPDSVGTAFKTISMRIRGAKTELEEAGLETEGMVESTAKLRSEIMALTGVDIMDGANQFKSTYAIMSELAAKWQDLSDIQQATVTELIAGKRQGNIVSSLMNNFDIAEKALETSLNSAGSAMKEHEKWQQSLEAQILSLKASWQGLSQAFLSSDFLKVAFDFIIKLVDGITLLIDKVGILPTILTGFSIFKSFGNNGLFKTLDNDLDGFTNKLGIANKSLAELLNAFKSGSNNGGIKGFINGLKSMGDALVNPLSQFDLSAIESYNKLIDDGIDSQIAFAQTMNGTSNAAQSLVKSANGGKVALNGMKTATIGSKVALIGAKAAAIAFNAALTMGISLLIDFAISGIMKLVNAKKDLAESVEEVTSKFKEQHSELQKLKGDYDTTNEESMVSKYGKLSKGVDNLGRNVSLTADEYSEYQDIVNKIAEQMPNLVSGYDEQGNAILNCKGNVESLTTAYETLIHKQNQAILTGQNSKDIEKNWKNAVSQASEYDFFEKQGNSLGDWLPALVGFKNLSNFDMKTGTAKFLAGLTKDSSDKYIEEGLGRFDSFRRTEIVQALQGAGYDVNIYSDISKTLKDILKDEPQKIQEILNNYYSGFDKVVEEYKTKATALLSDAFDVSSAISGLNYGNISEDLQQIAYQVVNGLDFKFLENLESKGITIEQWTGEMLDQLNSIGKADNAQIEAAFDLQTKFNGGEISYGEYVQGLKDTEKVIRDLRVKDNVKEQLRISLGLDEDGVIEQYQQLRNRLASEDFDIMPADYEPFIEGLSSEELSVLCQIIPELSETDYKETIADIKAALEKEMMLQGLTFDLNLEVEAAGIEALNTALAESVSASGLSSESIAALKGRYANLESQGYDLSSMFEETSHGIRLNRQEFNKLENIYSTQKLADIDSDLTEMKIAYDDLGEAIKNCDDPIKKSELFNDRQTLANKISEAATLAHQYKGLTSAYNDWLAAEEAGQERDMYEKVIEGFENIDDEIKRGWLDDGTIEFLELLTGKDLSTSSIDKIKEAYDGLDNKIKDTTYSVRDFFTVDEDGNSTNAGVYNFLDAIGQLEEEKFGGKDVVKRDKDGNIIAFDFEIAGGDEAIADALGISEELVQIMVRAADDAGFVVSMDGTYRQLADLQNEAKAAADYLHQIGKTDFEFDFNTSSIENLKTQLEEAHKILDSKEFWNKDGTFNFNADGATQAMQVVSTLQAKLDKLTEEKYGIGLTVEDEEFEEPLENLQEYGRNIATLNQLELNPKANAEEIEKINGELNEIAEYFANLDDDLKVQLGFESDDGIEEVKKKIESGEVKIPTVLDIQANMDKNIETLTDLAFLNSGLLSEKEETIIKKKLGIEVEADEVDTSKVDEKVDEVLNGDGGFGGRDRNDVLSRKTNIEIIADTFGIEDVDDLSTKLKGLDDKTIQAIAEVIGQIDVDKLRTTLSMVNPVHVQAIAEAIGKGDVDALKEAVGKLHPNHVQAIAEALGFDEVSDLNAAIENLDPKTVQAVAQALGITDVDGLKSAIDNVQSKDVEVNATTSGEEKLSGLKRLIDNIKSKTVTITSWFKKITSGGSTRNDSNGFNEVNGTANVDGTTGRAFKQGSWGTKNSGTALVGELGREILVRGGRYYTIGDTGAEFIKYQKGDIIFNHKQTEELFANGKVTSGGGRAKAFASGTAFSKGSGGIGRFFSDYESEKSKKERKEVESKTSIKNNKNSTTVVNETTVGNGSSGSGGGIGKAGGSAVGSSSEKEKFEETYDWIETAINRIERAIDQLDTKANSVYRSWFERNSALVSEISKVKEEIELQQNAYNRYIEAANAVGLSSSWAAKVRNGEIDIDTVTDEDLADKISKYKEW